MHIIYYYNGEFSARRNCCSHRATLTVMNRKLRRGITGGGGCGRKSSGHFSSAAHSGVGGGAPRAKILFNIQIRIIERPLVIETMAARRRRNNDSWLERARE